MMNLQTAQPNSPAPETTLCHAGSVAAILQRIKGEYLELPELKLTQWQARRLWGLEGSECEAILAALVDTRFLRRTPDGSYVRAR